MIDIVVNAFAEHEREIRHNSMVADVIVWISVYALVAITTACASMRTIATMST
jgi:hypothetical protein